MDCRTQSGTLGRYARVRVEVEKNAPRKSEILMEKIHPSSGKELVFKQVVIYEDPPVRCSHCLKYSHTVENFKLLLNKDDDVVIVEEREANTVSNSIDAGLKDVTIPDVGQHENVVVEQPGLREELPNSGLLVSEQPNPPLSTVEKQSWADAYDDDNGSESSDSVESNIACEDQVQQHITSSPIRTSENAMLEPTTTMHGSGSGRVSRTDGGSVEVSFSEMEAVDAMLERGSQLQDDSFTQVKHRRGRSRKVQVAEANLGNGRKKNNKKFPNEGDMEKGFEVAHGGNDFSSANYNFS
ncbi:hypothetical protein NE237_009797 [Protea cynaroides]|uniref:Uncharacterized protein n=1 Tax=Protea cynaroides TaxID=273540 RepID=A0A9Q0R0Z8_9MAGN|nr:hypothetical protein NE237_009797 [Protea cynaroides]